MNPDFRNAEIIDGWLIHTSAMSIFAEESGFRHPAIKPCPMLSNSFQTTVPEAGCDEAGRGSLAGDVFAAAVILPPDFIHPLLNDSKRMTRRNRERMREVIVREALSWAVGRVSAAEIDRMNILNASFEAMSRAVEGLDVIPGLLLIDGNRFRPRLPIDYRCEVKGDGRFMNIAAASVLAKTFRDDYMLEMDTIYPQYGWRSNMGYPTREHRAAIERFGPSPIHRMTFTLLDRQQTLFDTAPYARR